jgi:hypothetical protein
MVISKLQSKLEIQLHSQCVLGYLTIAKRVFSIEVQKFLNFDKKIIHKPTNNG